MSPSVAGELVWRKSGGVTSLGLYLPPNVREGFRSYTSAHVSNVSVPVWVNNPQNGVLYRHPIAITKTDGVLIAGPVFAILAASGEDTFIGSRANFRDIIQTARQKNVFVYVLSVRHVTGDSRWMGYVRTGHQRWIPLPCPKPEAVYNRIPNRALERGNDALTAKTFLQSERIPLFNPEYFNKANIYNALRSADLYTYLPNTVNVFSIRDLQDMVARHKSVYLKPAGGSIGHGMIRVSRQGNRYEVSVLKNSRCQTWAADGIAAMCNIVKRERLPGHYVIQEAISLIRWQGRACDFRVLLQKAEGEWRLVGRGVRVSGENTITTHVPNGGYIASADRVLVETFGPEANEVSQKLETMVVTCAEAIDAHYRAELGEMSMDIGVDERGNPWFFEANAKPMKFDEKEIRERSLHGVLAHLEELRQHRFAAEKKS